MDRRKSSTILDDLSYFIGRKLVVDAIKAESLINKIHDYFESRNCESCEFYEDGVHFLNARKCDGNCVELNINVEKTFYCNHWCQKKWRSNYGL